MMDAQRQSPQHFTMQSLYPLYADKFKVDEHRLANPDAMQLIFEI